MPRGATLAGRLAALGFADTASAERLLTGGLGLDLGGADAGIVAAIAEAADPDLALAGLAALEPDHELLDQLRSDAGLRARLIAILGVSSALAEHLRRERADWRLLSTDALDRTPEPGRDISAGSPDALRVEYRRRLLTTAGRDLTGAAAIEDVMGGLSDLAAAAIRAALDLARSGLPADAEPCRLAVIAMGKCGAGELNYASDVDVIFVAEGVPGGDETAALRTATQLASAVIRVCAERGTAGAMFPLDAGLRPEGRIGPLVRTLASHVAYYRRWAKTWEFQALLKARPVAGDAELGRQYLDSLTPMVWQAAQRADFVADVQAMRRRVVESLPAGQADREIKLGPGGLRDVEFAVQLLQLVHGRADEALRDRATLPALAALAAGGYVGRQDAASLADSYRFLRAVEHLLQLRQLRRTHSLPVEPAALRQLGRAMRSLGYLPGRPGDPAADLTAQWRSHAAVARQLHEKLFYRPLLDAVARLPGDVIRLTSQAAKERLEALGYLHPAGALRHIEALTTGVSRKAAIQRALLPAMLEWFADAPRPDAGLLAFRQVSEALGDSPWYLRLLRDDTNVAWRMARLLASGRYPVDLLLRAPGAVAMLADESMLRPRAPQSLAAEAEAVLRRHDRDDPGEALAGLLALRRGELLRTAAADVLGLADLGQVSAALSAVTAVTVGAALTLAGRIVARAAAADLPIRMCVIGMGRFGGHELGYGSDADVLFVYEPLPGVAQETAARAAHAVADGLRAMLDRPGPDPSLRLDADLRPEGKQGPLVRTLSAYRAYYDRWAAPWELQALLRADQVAGDAGLGLAFIELADEYRYPREGIDDLAVREIKRIKARMEAERIPRGVDRALHVKLGGGGLTDTEWVVQLLQLRHGGKVPGLRTTRTLAALTAASDAGLLTAQDAAALGASWQLAARIRNAVMLVTGRPSDMLPTAQPDLAAAARLLGYPAEASHDLVQDWRKAARRARAAMELTFYGGVT
jgi:glutamate-ammonia-ligase adenylyltransferase